MNELSIVMHLLSRRVNKYQIGASEEEICNMLDISGRYQATLFHQILVRLSHYIEILGLNIRYNPINNHWYIAHESGISDIIKANPFEDKPRLAASLFIVIISCFSNFGKTTISEIAKLRKKKSILTDLQELEQIGYILLDKNNAEISLTPLIGYELDINHLLTNVALKIREEE
jgi:hypothetical protein